MKTTLLLLLLAAASLRAADSESQALWRASVASVSAAGILDVHSSWGKHERNGTLAGPAGAFGARGTAIKSGIQASIIACEYLLIRKHPRAGKLYRAAAVVNFIAAGVTGATAARNYGFVRH
jgi:hypothetical protein